MTINIACADWVDFMQPIEKNTVDLILTDPPYGISRKTGHKNIGEKGVARFAVSMEFGEWDNAQIDLKSFCKESYRVLRKGGTAIIFYDLWKISHLKEAMELAGFKMIRLIVWEKTNPVPLNQSATYLSNTREVAVVGVKIGKPTFHGKYDNGVYNLPIPRHGGNRQHSTQKCETLFTNILLKHSNPKDLVCDPFLGVGTTSVCCDNTGRKFIGCDISPDYIKIAKDRIIPGGMKSIYNDTITCDDCGKITGDVEPAGLSGEVDLLLCAECDGRLESNGNY